MPLRRTRLERRRPVKPYNPKRRAAEFARCYGSKERVEWVQAQRCSVPGCHRAPCDNAHVVRDGSEGMSRRGGYRCVAPLCRFHHGVLDTHPDGPRAFEHTYSIDLMTAAAMTHARWRALATPSAP